MTLGLLTACVLSLVYTQSRESEVRSVADAGLERAVNYFNDHPYLERPALLSERLAQGGIDGSPSSQGPRIPAPVKRRQQQELEDLVVASFAPYAALPTYRLGLRATEPTLGGWLRYPWLHANWLHLAGNALLLLLLGTYLERAWRSRLFAAFVTLAALVSGWSFTIVNPQLADPLIGMAGVIAGLLGAFSVRFIHLWRDPKFALLLLAGSGWLIAAGVLGWDPSIAGLLASTLKPTGQLGASFGAVGGGIAFGLASAVLVKVSAIEFEPSDPPVKLDAAAISEILESAQSAHADGRSEEAQLLIADLVRTQPSNRDVLLASWQMGLDLGQADEAVAALIQVVDQEIRAGEQQAAIEHWLQLVEQGLERHVQPSLLIRLALLLSAAERTADAVHAFRSAIAGATGENAGSIAARVARGARDIDPALAEDAAWRALSDSNLSFEERLGLEALLARLGTHAGDAAKRIEMSCGEDESEVSSQRDESAGFDPSSSGPAFALQSAETDDENPLVQWEDPELSDQASRLEASGLEESLAGVDHDEALIGDAAASSAQHPTPIELEFTSRQIEALACVPTGISEAGLDVEAGAGAKKRIPFDRMQAVCVAAIAAEGVKPVLLVDLVLNWNDGSQDELKVIRIRSDSFDPRSLVASDGAPLDAMRELIDRLLAGSGATPLPDLDAARGFPFVSFADISSYQYSILSVEPTD